ncbi:hypothetical protein, conserved [Eimeria maxima]|uniref:Transmembrane protein n=1 Tax=Eimeria maxima TaxID=5804 RepID=U6ME89_EIMMA|nr:hypothetical protein, conserved [Eimeria maxima]CDJ61378.1 hypothetical protein, conserved [Eimeria maxima]
MDSTAASSSIDSQPPQQPSLIPSESSLNEFCEPASRAAHSEEPSEKKERLGFFAGLFLGLEGNLRRATTAATDTLGVYTLPSLFIGGSLLGVAAATISFKSRMRALRAVNATTSAAPVCAPARYYSHRTLALSPTAADSPAAAAGTSAATPHPVPCRDPQAASVIATELSRHRHQQVWDTGDDDEESGTNPEGAPRGPPSATELFTPKELATLFLLPAATILSVLSGVWLFLKWQSNITGLQHFIAATRWLAGSGPSPPRRPS